MVSKLSALCFLKNIKEVERMDTTVLFPSTVGLFLWDEAGKGKLVGAPASVGRFAICGHQFQA